MSEIGADFFVRNRERLREAFGGTAPIVITAHSALQRSNDSAYPFTQDSNFWYLTGIGEPGFILVMDRGKEYLIAPPRSDSQIAFEGDFDREALASIAGISEIIDDKAGWERLSRRLSKVKHVATLQPATPYIESMDMFTNPSRSRLVLRLREQNESLDLIDLRPHLTNLRMIKSAEELSAIKQAIKETIKIFGIIEKKRAKATHEHHLLADISKDIIKNEYAYAYDPILAGGINAVTLHYTKNNAPLHADELLLLDIGLKVNGYNADLTRTVVAEPTKRQQAVYDAVLDVHRFACSLLRPGTDLRTYETAVQHYMGEKLRELGLIQTITKEAVREYYPHTTSHFLGIDVHDVADYEQSLAPGMVLTVEPGIYIRSENIGIRLEDNVVITKSGHQNLSSQLPKNIRSLTIESNA